MIAYGVVVSFLDVWGVGVWCMEQEFRMLIIEDSMGVAQSIYDMPTYERI